MASPVVVEFTRDELDKLDCSHYKDIRARCEEGYVRSKLAFAGIPLTPFGIYPKVGALTVTQDVLADKITYKWWPTDVRAGISS